MSASGHQEFINKMKNKREWLTLGVSVMTHLRKLPWALSRVGQPEGRPYLSGSGSESTENNMKDRFE